MTGIAVSRVVGVVKNKSSKPRQRLKTLTAVCKNVVIVFNFVCQKKLFSKRATC
jgi:hypothetical protein